MKNKFIFCLVFLFFLFIAIDLSSAEVTGETVSGEVVSQPVTMNITITTTSLPSLTILKPENETYLTAENLLLNFISTNSDNNSFNLDGGSNTTITSNSTFNTTEGAHTLFLYAENVQGTTEKNISFFVNSTKFVILYDEYFGSLKGISTNFNQSSYEDIQILSGIVLENTDWGKIEFNETINLTNDLVFNDNLLDLDNHTNISNNRIELNSTAIPNFNKSVTLYLYNLTFSNPRVLRDGVVCSDSVCTEVSYSSGTFVFTVTGFSVYSAEETPSEDVVIPSTSGGGGGSILNVNFSLDKDLIDLKIKQGERAREIILVDNIGDRAIQFDAYVQRIERFVILSEESFSLSSGDSKEINADFFVGTDEPADVYAGRIIVEGGSITKSINVILEVLETSALFDIRSELKYDILTRNKEIEVEMSKEHGWNDFAAKHPEKAARFTSMGKVLKKPT